ncbi:hypothetical protein IWW49_001917 [Coemansia sp. RSA 1797]|nr:hypothetical protein IWW49_001917 [Coemansia sp. RSA 1797]
MASNRENGQKKPTTNSSLLDIGESSDESAEMPSLLFDQDQQSDTSSNERKTFRIAPPSDLLSRLHAFLPQIAEANTKLAADISEDPSKLDIENVGAEESQYIEMDLGLGVFDMKSKDDSKSAEGIIIGARGSASSDESDDETECPRSRVIIDPSSIANRQKPKPHIEMLADESSSSDSDSDSSMDSSSDSDSDEEMNM